MAISLGIYPIFRQTQVVCWFHFQTFSISSEVKEAEMVAETLADLDESPSKALGFGDAGMFGVRLNSN